MTACQSSSIISLPHDELFHNSKTTFKKITTADTAAVIPGTVLPTPFFVVATLVLADPLVEGFVGLADSLAEPFVALAVSLEEAFVDGLVAFKDEAVLAVANPESSPGITALAVGPRGRSSDGTASNREDGRSPVGEIIGAIGVEVVRAVGEKVAGRVGVL